MTTTFLFYEESRYIEATSNNPRAPVFSSEIYGRS